MGDDGQIRYPQSTNWRSWVDSVGDIGRLASLFHKAKRVCTPQLVGHWAEKHTPRLLALGRRMLALKAAGTDGRLPPRGAPRPESAGLVAGSPEADWSHFKANVSRDNETWYNVNVWLQRGMAEIGTDSALPPPFFLTVFFAVADLPRQTSAQPTQCPV